MKKNRSRGWDLKTSQCDVIVVLGRGGVAWYGIPLRSVEVGWCVCRTPVAKSPFPIVTSCKGAFITEGSLALPSLGPFAFGLLSYFYFFIVVLLVGG